jgi:hypothetical protein
MKHFFAICFLLAFATAFAQSTEISAKYDKIGKFDRMGFATVTQKGLVGVINKDGKEIVTPAYDHISGFTKDGLAFTRKKDLVGVIDNTGKVIIDNKYDYISHFKGNHAVVKKNGLCGVIDRTGKVVVDMKYEKLVVEGNGIIKAINPDKTEVLIKPNS